MACEMSGSSNVSTDENCYDEFNAPVYTAVAAVRAGVGTFSAACCLAVIVIIVFYKKYNVFAQRLVLNLAIAALIHSLSYPLARVDYYSDLRLMDPYCYFGSFFNMYSAWVEVLALMCIVVHLFVGGILGRPTHKFEPAFWISTYTLPILWSWIPFIHHAYGTSGAWCGIRVLDENCNSFSFGKSLQFALWYIPLYTLLFITCVISLLVAIKVRKDISRWSGLYDADTKAKREKMQKEVTPLLWFPAIYLILNTFSFIDRIYNAAEPNDPVVELTFLHALTSPFRGAFVALVYALVDPATRKRLRWHVMMASCKDYFHGAQVVEYAAVIDDTESSISYSKSV